MKIDNVKLPPVSQSFFNRLQAAFPPLDPLDIKKDTDMIEIQRNAAQQEVIKFISNAVRKENSHQPKTWWERFKHIW